MISVPWINWICFNFTFEWSSAKFIDANVISSIDHRKIKLTMISVPWITWINFHITFEMKFHKVYSCNSIRIQS